MDLHLDKKKREWGWEELQNDGRLDNENQHSLLSILIGVQDQASEAVGPAALRHQHFLIPLSAWSQ